MGLLLKVVFSALVNFTVGMVSSIFVFVFKLPWILADYKPGWVRFCILLAYQCQQRRLSMPLVTSWLPATSWLLSMLCIHQLSHHVATSMCIR